MTSRDRLLVTTYAVLAGGALLATQTVLALHFVEGGNLRTRAGA